MRILDFIAGLIGLVCFAPVLLLLRLIGVRFETVRTLTVGKGARLFWRRRLVIRPGRASDLAVRLGLSHAPDCLSLLKGELALVGPRPLAPLDPHAVASYRIALRPGLLSPFAVGAPPFAVGVGEDAVDFVYAAGRTFLGDIEILMRGLRQAASPHTLTIRSAN